MKMFFIVKRLDGKQERAIHCFDKPTVLIGTEFGDLEAGGGEVSEAQTLFYFRPDGSLHVRNLSYFDGTYVNGVKITDKALLAGDHVRIGNLSLEFLGAEDDTSPQVKRPEFRLLEQAG